jgi:hypothetical protein
VPGGRPLGRRGAGEDFCRGEPRFCKKAAVVPTFRERPIAIFATVSTASAVTLIFPLALGRKGNFGMERVRSLFQSAPSRIRRRLAQIVAIAAASLPEAGA